MNLIIGSRGSQLALWQANWVKSRLEAEGHHVAIETIVTSGDTSPGGPGNTKALFVKEIEEALLEGRVHLAVHSMKDMPAALPEGLEIGAVPVREDPRDALISKEALVALPAGSKIGTSSLRRAAQLLNARPDLQVEPLRGNIDTRLRKFDEGRYDAIILAAAGLHRLGWQSRIRAYFEPHQMCPAIGQGALAIEIRSTDSKTREALEELEDRRTRLATTSERAVQARLGGGCQLPVGAHARFDGRRMKLIAVVASPDGHRLVRAAADGDNAGDLGRRVAEDLLAQGADEILKEVYPR